MDEKELQALYNAISAKFNVGDFNFFKSKMQTTEQRKSFYDVVSQKGFDVGPYDKYEFRLSGLANAKSQPVLPEKKKENFQSSAVSQIGSGITDFNGPLPKSNVNTGTANKQSSTVATDKPVSGVNSATLSYKKGVNDTPGSDPIGEVLQPIQEHDYENQNTLLKYGNQYALPSDNTRQAPVRDREGRVIQNYTANLVNNAKRSGDYLRQTENDLYQNFFKNGKEATEYIQQKIKTDNPDELQKNKTVQFALGRAGRFNELSNQYNQTPDIEQLALKLTREANPYLNKQLEVLQENGKQIPQVVLGSTIEQFIKDPDIQALAENNPTLKQQLSGLENDKIYEKYPDYGEVVARNIISRAYEKQRANIVANPIFDKSSYLDKLSDKLFADRPILKKIADERLKGNWSGKIDTAGVVDEFATGASDSVKGMVNSAKDLVGLGKSESSRIESELEKQYGSVSSGVKGWRKDLNDVANFGGVIFGMAGPTGALKAVLAPELATGYVTAATFFDGEKNKAAMKFPGEPWKQNLSAAAMTMLYSIAHKALPSNQVAKVLIKSEPQINEVIANLGEKATKDEMRNAILRVAQNTISGSIKGTGQMLAIKKAEHILDGVLGYNRTVEQETDEMVDTAKSMMLGLMVPNILSSVSNRNKVADSYYSIAENPTRFKDVLQLNAPKDQTGDIQQKISDVDFLAETKRQLDDANVPKNEQPRKLLEAMAERYKVANVEQKDTTSQEDDKPGISVIQPGENPDRQIVTIKPQREQSPEAISTSENPENSEPAKTQDLPETEEDLLKRAEEAIDTDVLPDFREAFKSDVKGALKEAAEQLNSSPSEAETARKFYGDTLSDIALKLFPDAKTNINPEGELAKLNAEIGKTEQTDLPETTTGQEDITEQKQPAENVGQNDVGRNDGGDNGAGNNTKLIHIERPNTELSFRGLQNVANEFGYEDVKSRDTVSDFQEKENARKTINDWVDKGIYSKNINDLLNKIENRETVPTAKQRLILEQHLANEVARLRSIKDINSNEYNDQLSRVKRIKDVGLIARQEAGAALRLPGKSNTHPASDLIEAYSAMLDAANSEVLTKEQKGLVQSHVDEYKKRADEADKKIKALEDKVAELEAEKSIKKDQKQPNRKKTKQDFQAERKSAIEELKEAKEKHEQWLKEQGIQKSGFGITLTNDMVKAIAKIVKSYVEEFGSDLATVTEKVFNEVKSIFPGVEKRDIHDVIAGKYNEKKPPLSELQQQLRDLRIEASLMNQLDELSNGINNKKTKNTAIVNSKIKGLRSKINDVRKKQNLPKISAEEKRLNTYILETKKKIESIEEKIKNKNFDPEPKKVSIYDDPEIKKKYPQLVKDALDAKIKLQEAGLDFDAALLKEEMSRMNKLQKVGYFGRALVSTIKGITAGIDFSATLIQNNVAALANPKFGIKAIGRQFRDFASPKAFKRNLERIKSNEELWDLMQKSGLDITDPSSLEEGKHEESFDLNLLNKDLTIKGKTYKTSKIGNVILKPFERAFTSMGNQLRADLFARMVEKLREKGKTIENSEKDYKDAANIINTITGRGKLPEGIQRGNKLWTTIIWSPRLMASRFNLLGITDLTSPVIGKRGYYTNLTPEMRKFAISQTAKWAAIQIGLMAAGGLFGRKVDDDPRSSSFGDIKITDNVSWNFTGQHSAYIRLIANLLTRQRKVDGKVQDLNPKDVQLLFPRFLRGRTTPFIGSAIDIATGRDYMGKPTTAMGVLKRNLPLSLQDLSNAIKRDGISSLLTSFGPGVLGIKVSDQRDFPQKAETINIGGIEKEIPENLLPLFNDMKEKNLKNYLSIMEHSGEYKNASDEQKKKIESMVKSMATDDAKNKLISEHIDVFKPTKEDIQKKGSEERTRGKIKGLIKSQIDN